MDGYQTVKKGCYQSCLPLSQWITYGRMNSRYFLCTYTYKMKSFHIHYFSSSLRSQAIYYTYIYILSTALGCYILCHRCVIIYVTIFFCLSPLVRAFSSIFVLHQVYYLLICPSCSLIISRNSSNVHQHGGLLKKLLKIQTAEEPMPRNLNFFGRTGSWEIFLQ